MTSALYKNGLNGTSDKSVRLMTNSEFTWNIPGNKIVSQDLKTNTRVWITDHSKATIKASKLYIVPDFIVHKKARIEKDRFRPLTVFLTFQLVFICLVEVFAIALLNMMENWLSREMTEKQRKAFFLIISLGFYNLPGIQFKWKSLRIFTSIENSK